MSTCILKKKLSPTISFFEVVSHKLIRPKNPSGKKYIVRLIEYHDQYQTKEFEVFHPSENIPEFVDPPFPMGEPLNVVSHGDDNEYLEYLEYELIQIVKKHLNIK